MSFAGGPGTASISLDPTHVYYAAGSSVRRVLKAGGFSQWVAGGTGINRVYARHTKTGTRVFWTAANAVVRSRLVGSSTSVVHWAGAPGRVATSIGFDGTRVLWSDSEGSTPSFPSGCTMRRLAGGVVTRVASTSGHFYLAALQWDASAMYFGFGSAFGLKKYVH